MTVIISSKHVLNTKLINHVHVEMSTIRQCITPSYAPSLYRESYYYRLIERGDIHNS